MDILSYDDNQSQEKTLISNQIMVPTVPTFIGKSTGENGKTPGFELLIDFSNRLLDLRLLLRIDSHYCVLLEVSLYCSLLQ